MKLTGGYLGSEYKLLQIHFHWDVNANGLPVGPQGSEHTVTRKGQTAITPYRGEVHFVHGKVGADLSDLSTAAGDDLAVLGFFLDVDDSLPKSWFDYTLDDLIDVNVQDTASPPTAEIEIDWTASSMLPKELDGFWRYEGSLTTPTCNEIVRW